MRKDTKMKIKIDKRNKQFAILYHTPDEFIGGISKEGIDQLKNDFNARWFGLPYNADFNDLVARLAGGDEEAIRAYKEISASITTPPKARVSKRRRYMDEGKAFHMDRYLNGNENFMSRDKACAELGKSKSRVVNVFVNLVANGRTPADAITSRCTAAMIAVKALQQRGISTRIIAYETSKGMCYNDAGDWDALEGFVVKRPEDALVPPKVLPYISSYFFRAFCVTAVAGLPAHPAVKWDSLVGGNMTVHGDCGRVAEMSRFGKELQKFIGYDDNCIDIPAKSCESRGEIIAHLAKYGIKLK